jgi:VanZ family protein
LFSYLEKNKSRLVYLPLIVYWIILFTATSIPAQSVPSFGVGDKFNHFFAYFILAILLYLTLSFQEKSIFTQRNAALLTIAIILLYGVLDELHQMLIPGRSAEFLDWAADAIGAICGVLIVSSLLKKFKREAETG